MKRSPTYNAGANAERSAILAHVRRMKVSGIATFVISTFEGWLLQRAKRYNRRKGGIGK